ncbi:MAG: hypothetical protein Kow00129_06950 [Thermoleophilia bacterium]
MSRRAAFAGVPAAVACLILVAHYVRVFEFYFAAVFLLLPLLLLIRSRWAVRVVQIALVFGAFEWLTAMLLLISRRQAAGEAYGRGAAILAAVAILTLTSAVLLQLRARALVSSSSGRT